TAALGNATGVRIGPGPNANTVGGMTPAEANVISGNGTGVQLQGAVTANVVAGNLIGTDASGTQALGNTIGLQIDSSNNVTDPTTAAALNTIAANNVAIELSDTAAANTVIGLRIGTNPAGTAAIPLPNDVGLLILGADNRVGGPNPPDANVIS